MRKIMTFLVVMLSLALMSVGIVAYLDAVQSNDSIPIFPDEPVPPELVTLTFKNVGYTYLVKNWDNQSRHYFEEGMYTIEKGTELSVFIEGTNHYRAGAFIVNNETISKDHLSYSRDRNGGVEQSLTIEAIIVETPLKKALDIFEANNITVVRIEDLWRARGFSHSLMQVKFESIEGLIQVAQDKDINTILWKRGREFKHGWVWDRWDYFIFLEGEYIFYRMQDI